MRQFLSFILLFILVFSAEISLAQKVEISAGISINMFNYTGSATSSNVSFYTFPVYSKTLTPGLDADLKVKIINKKGFIVGLGSGYEVVNSRANVNAFNESYLIYPGIYNNLPYFVQAAGYEKSTTKLIVINPFAGYRLKKKKYNIDFIVGGDIGFIAEQKQREVLTAPQNIDLTFYYNGSNNNTQQLSRRDYRLMGAASLNFNRIGLYLSYARGLNSQIYIKPGLQDVGYGKAYTQLIKLGIHYRIL